MNDQKDATSKGLLWTVSTIVLETYVRCVNFAEEQLLVQHALRCRDLNLPNGNIRLSIETTETSRCFVGISWIYSALLIGNDELGGASGRVHCIGVRPVLASKQWMPEDGSEVGGWLALRRFKMWC